MWFYDKILFYIKLLFVKEKELYSFLYRFLGFCPGNMRLYRQALCHRSEAANSTEGRSFNNERLEFLGDAVLNAVIAGLLYRKFPHAREGFLTNTRSKIVQRDTLNRIADESGLAKHVKFSRPAHIHNCFMGGNALEAVIGAVYLDRGYRCCRRFVEKKIVNSYIDIRSLSRKVINFKSKLLEWCQKHKLELVYELVSTSTDSEGCTVFHSSVAVGGIEAGKGKGYTKKESQQEAAREALSRIGSSEAFREKLLATAAEVAVAK